MAIETPTLLRFPGFGMAPARTAPKRIGNTAKNYVSSILAKMGVRDRTRAVLKALEAGDL